MNGTTFPSFDDEDDNTASGPGFQKRQNFNQGNYQRAERSYDNNNQGFQKGNYQKDNYQKGGFQKGGFQKGGFQKGGFQRSQEPLDPTVYLPYAVTGNKDVPPEIVSKVKELVNYLNGHGFTSRMGCDDPIENAAYESAAKKEAILPWREFNSIESKFTFTNDRAMAIAKKFHPTFDNMKKGIQLILAKNARLILGNRMDQPARFLLCWTEDGVENIRQKTAKTGYTGHTIAIACGAGVPVFNLANPDAEKRLREYVESIYQAA